MSAIDIRQYRELLRKFLGQRTDQDFLQELDAQITAVLPLEGDRPDWAFLKAERLCAVGHVIQPVAAVSHMRLRNPVASGVVATMTAWFFSCATSDDMTMSVEAQVADLGTPVATAVRDTRWPLTATGLVASEDLTVAAPGDIFWFQTLGGASTPSIAHKFPFVLTPGFAVNLGINGVTSAALHVTILWTERRFGPLEIS